MPKIFPIIKNQRSRGNQDEKHGLGSGQFYASRTSKSGGKYNHKGLDVISYSGQKIFAPFDGIITRIGYPYKDSKNYKLIEIRGQGEWKKFRVKIFYINPIRSTGKIKGGELIGTAQDLTKKYEKITNHVHLEVYQSAMLLNPFVLYKMCF